MFYNITGALTHKEPGMAVLTTGGVGFKLSITLNTLGKLPKIGEEATLYTYLNVKEDALDLYGFWDLAEENCFKMLLTVSGVGPKAALGLLSDLTPERFALAVAADDVKALKAVPGIGPKTAQRIILELKDKLKGADLGAAFTGDSGASGGSFTGAGNLGEAVSALVVLGYGHSEAASVLVGVSDDTSVEEMIKIALKKLAQQ